MDLRSVQALRRFVQYTVYLRDVKNGVHPERSPAFIGTVAPMNGCVGIGMAKGKEHARHKRAIAPSFTKAAIFDQRDVLHQHVEAFMNAMLKHYEEGKPVNAARWCESTESLSRETCYF